MALSSVGNSMQKLSSQRRGYKEACGQILLTVLPAGNPAIEPPTHHPYFKASPGPLNVLMLKSIGTK